MPSDNGAIFLGVDLDGVCANFYARMREIAAEWFEVDIVTLTESPSYGLEEWGIQTRAQYEQLHRFAVTQRALFATAPPIPGARSTLRRLSDEGYQVRIIPHRLFIHFFHQARGQPNDRVARRSRDSVGKGPSRGGHLCG